MISMSVLICVSVLIDSKVSVAGNIVLSFLCLLQILYNALHRLKALLMLVEFKLF